MLCGMLSHSITFGLLQFVVHRCVFGKLRQTTTDIKHARLCSYVIKKERPHLTYPQAASMNFDLPTCRLLTYKIQQSLETRNP